MTDMFKAAEQAAKELVELREKQAKEAQPLIDFLNQHNADNNVNDPETHFNAHEAFRKDYESIIEEAKRIIYGERREDYGGAEESFTSIWIGWEIILSSDIPGSEKVALCMDWLKTCRYLNGRQRDSLVYKIGYVGCIEQIRGNDL